MERKIIADTREHEESRVAILEEGRLAEVFIERAGDRQRAGEIYKARVDNVLPGLSAAFLSLGEGRNAFLYLNDAPDTQEGQEMVVQVTKPSRKNKGARVSPRISLPGRYLVLVPGGTEAGVSRRIPDEDERRRLRAVAKALRGDDFGVIVRTAAEGVDEEELAADLDPLLTLWREIEHKAQTQPAPSLLYQDIGLLGRVLRDELRSAREGGEVIVDDPEELDRVEDFLAHFGGPNRPSVSLYDGPVPIFEFYGLDREIEGALDRKVWLRSGAYLVIEHTEALTVIDVNTGKFVAGDMRHTTLATNLEAADEIARQIRLRAIGGIVVVDFIDMELEEDRRELIARLDGAFQDDRFRARVFGVTQLGLVEMTRKRGRSDLRSTLTRACPCCGETGWVLREETVAMSVKRFLRKIIRNNRFEAALLQMHPDIARHIAQNCLEGWERELGRRVLLAGTPGFLWGKFRVEFQGALDEAERRAERLRRREAGTVVHQLPAP